MPSSSTVELEAKLQEEHSRFLVAELNVRVSISLSSIYLGSPTAHQLGTVIHSTCAWNCYPSHLSSCVNAFKTFLFSGLMFTPVESAADLSDDIQLFYYIRLLGTPHFSFPLL